VNERQPFPDEELTDFAGEAANMLSRFKRSNNGELWIGDGDQSRLKGIVLEATTILNDTLGLAVATPFVLDLRSELSKGAANFYDSQSYASVERIKGILVAAAKTTKRRRENQGHSTTPPPLQPSALPPPYVSTIRISELRTKNSTAWDLKKLVRMCEELNSSFAKENYLASAMLLRAITDHVPPIFGAKNFAEYASSVASRSHKGNMENLQRSLRNIADGVLHQQIRDRESLPTDTMVDFRQDLDVLLAEVLRVA
jgi:hypothetical protein